MPGAEILAAAEKVEMVQRVVSGMECLWGSPFQEAEEPEAEEPVIQAPGSEEAEPEPAAEAAEPLEPV